jgi:thiamine kinase-like enzyme
MVVWRCGIKFKFKSSQLPRGMDTNQGDNLVFSLFSLVWIEQTKIHNPNNSMIASLASSQRIQTRIMIDSDNDDASLNLSVDSIDDLTKGFLTNLLQKHWETKTSFKEVQQLSFERVPQGVLSQVYRVNAIYDYTYSDCSSADDQPIPNQWIIKLPRKDLVLDWMFRSERIFYEVVAPILREAELPFTVPRMLFAAENESCLILEGVENVTCHSLVSGTPADKIDFVTFALASLHATSFKSDLFESKTRGLNCPPGIGHRLQPLKKEYLFTQQWRDTVEAIQLQDKSVQDFIVNLCEGMETRRLRDVHAMVHKERYACVHGDFHIANWLFPDDSSRKPALVDWATFGFGNPMTDLAFFLVLNETVATNVEEWLEKYYKNLTTRNPDLILSFPFEHMLDAFRLAILYQWIILVTYNNMNKQLAIDKDNPKQTEANLKHFENVNRRAVIAMHRVGHFEPILKRIPVATDQERSRAKYYSIETPLAI